MSRRKVSAVDASVQQQPLRRSWLKTAVAFIPFLTLVISAWLYAFHLHNLANQSMVRSKDTARRSTTTSGTEADHSSPSPISVDEDIVMGDSKDGIFYFIQVSDLHISSFRKASTANFYTFLSTALPLVEPAFVVVTGDLTDAKDKHLVGSMQYMDEWVTYRDALEESGVLTKRNGSFWHDLRGNHDCFNVPRWDSKENLFSSMSASKAPGFMFDVKANYGKYAFIGIDACPQPGPARPYNFFGLFETPDMDYLKQRLARTQGSNHTFVFSHYPVTTTMFGETSEGESFADLSASFSVYMCGHLHKLDWGLGEVLKSYQPSHFLELEVGDMKQHGIYRIMVVDHDMISFSDVSMPMITIPSVLMPSRKEVQNVGQESQSKQNGESSGEKNKRRPALGPRLPTNPIVVVTNPKDSRYLIPKHEPASRIGTSTHIRFLAWTDNQVPEGDHEYVRKDIAIRIKIDGKTHDSPVRFAGTRAEDQTADEEFLPLYVSEWNPQDYNDGKEHEIEIRIVDRFGRVGSSLNVFRVDGQRSDIKGGFGEWIMWSNIALLVKTIFTTGYLTMSLFMLILPKLYSLYLQTSPPPSAHALSKATDEMTSMSSTSTNDIPHYRNGYDAWLDQKRRHLYRLSSTLSSASSRHRFWNRFVNHTIHAHVLRFVHFSTQPILFYTTLIFTLLLVTAPHYWGNFIPSAGEQGQGYFYLQGIYLPNASGHLGGGLGTASFDPAGPERVRRPLSVLSGAISSITGGRLMSSSGSSSGYDDNIVGGTWLPMVDTWMSTIWTVIYDLTIFLYYLMLCATPSGYLYSPSNPHRLRPFHRTWYVRCMIIGIWVFRCCAVWMTAKLYGPSVLWTGIGTWWLMVVGWLMFMVGWSRSHVERDILLRKEDDHDHGEKECEDDVEGAAEHQNTQAEKVGLQARKDGTRANNEDEDDNSDE
ncbi:Transmembrane protein 62 [Modicella reniformis]|uniref:Transmembrane protein 62 n=1 Tax=Modicella reniformis TaxID=1440133 RepID=A0A9P6ILV3_9FUNG|nr:Transmembrane protein 62 [Modicella reniformis]